MNYTVVFSVASVEVTQQGDAKTAPGTVISGAGINPVPFFPLDLSTIMRLVLVIVHSFLL
jgi:hypothetical protein